MSEQNTALDMSVKIYPVHDSKNLLATASVTLGGCFAVRGIHIVDSGKGAFVSMPQRKDSKGEYHDVCFPTTAEMRAAINSAVLNEYQRTTERSFSRASQAMEKRASVLSKLRQPRQEAPRLQQPALAKSRDTGAR